jgi:DNA-binding MarR family transcriptional regulator
LTDLRCLSRVLWWLAERFRARPERLGGLRSALERPGGVWGRFGVAGGHELSMPRAQLLVALLRHGPQRISQLGGHVGISQGTASTLTEALVRDGLVERRTDPRDGRATQLALTATGQERTQAWLRDYEVAASEVFAALPPGQRPALLTALRILSAGS